MNSFVYGLIKLQGRIRFLEIHVVSPFDFHKYLFGLGSSVYQNRIFNLVAEYRQKIERGFFYLFLYAELQFILALLQIITERIYMFKTL